MDWIAFIALIVSALSAYITIRLTKEQAKLSLKQLTLSYIEMEDNDADLREARKWLYDFNNTQI